MRHWGIAAAVLSLVAGAAAAQPLQLTNSQMDKVSAGHFELDRSNVSVTMVDIWFRPDVLDSTPNTVVCPSCYLLIVSPHISIGSQMLSGSSIVGP